MTDAHPNDEGTGPHQPRTAGHAQLSALRGGSATAAVKARRARCGDEGMRAGIEWRAFMTIVRSPTRV